MKIPLVDLQAQYRTIRSEVTAAIEEVLADMRETYSASIAPEYMYIPFPDQKNWIRDRMESTRNLWPLETKTRLRILDRPDFTQ